MADGNDSKKTPSEDKSKAITNESVTDALGKLVQEIDTGNTNEDLELNFKFKGPQFEVGHEFYENPFGDFWVSDEIDPQLSWDMTAMEKNKKKKYRVPAMYVGFEGPDAMGLY